MLNDFKWTAKSVKRNELTERYEPLQPHFFAALASHVDHITFFDVGANVGYYSILMAKSQNIETVYCFEAMAEAFAECVKNVELNELGETVKCFNYAVSNVPQELEFLEYGPLHGANGVKESHFADEKKPHKILRISAKTLDDEFNLSGVNIFAKIDVEGHELNVLQGAKKLLKNNSGCMQIEIYKENRDGKRIHDFLNDIGWKKIHRIGPDYYFSNLAVFMSPVKILDVVELCHDRVIEKFLNNNNPARKALLPGVTLEVSRAIYNKLSFFRLRN